MEWLLLLSVGILFGVSTYLLLQNRLIRIIIGINILGQAINLLIFVAGYNRNHRAPIIKSSAEVLDFPASDPLPQALILTAIVIGFAMVAFFVVLVRRIFAELNTDQVEMMKGSDQ